MSNVNDAAPVRQGLAGCRAVVAVQGLTLAEPIVRGLERLGAKVARLQSRDDWSSEMDAGVRDLGGLDLVVHAAAPAVATCPAEIDVLSLPQWQEISGALFSTLCCLQAARRGLRAGGGTIVVLGPTAALVGAPGLVPLVTLAEAQRTLVKSAARQWGAQGIRLHWVGLAASHYSEELGEARIPPVPELGPPPPPLGRVPDAETDAVELIALLGRARGLTGATINLDGGDWMVP